MSSNVRVSINGTQRVFAPGRTLSLGRSDTADVHVEDMRASREHAELRWTGASWEITDLSTPNGTFVDGCVSPEQTSWQVR